jgi:hypothetical protein
MTNLKVAETILEQLGGNKFALMTGAKNFSGGEDYLSFGLSRNPSKVSHVIIKYDHANDLYGMKFLNVRGIDIKEVRVIEGLYFDQLQDLFSEVTGLYTHL